MEVRVMYRNNFFGGDGWTYYPVTVEISDYCPKCGAKRGKPEWKRFCEDGEWFEVNVWENPCGHIDKYRDVLIESGYVKLDRNGREIDKKRVEKELLIAILNAWQFCGNSKENAKQVFDDYNMEFDEEMFLKAMEIASEKIEEFKQEAEK